jgi:hypothetical protein
MARQDRFGVNSGPAQMGILYYSACFRENIRHLRSIVGSVQHKAAFEKGRAIPGMYSLHMGVATFAPGPTFMRRGPLGDVRRPGSTSVTPRGTLAIQCEPHTPSHRPSFEGPFIFYVLHLELAKSDSNNFPTLCMRGTGWRTWPGPLVALF